MSATDSLLSLANKLESEADAVQALVEDNPEMFDVVTSALAHAIDTLEKAAMRTAGAPKESVITTQTLEEMAAIAEAFDESGDSLLMKQALVLDEILLTLAVPKAVKIAEEAPKTEEAIKELYEKKRDESIKDVYTKAKEELDKNNKKSDIQSAVKEQVKEFKPLETSLSTRYCPDHPGVSVMRIADYTYQCPLDHKIYNWEAGFTTQKGNKVPGGGVDKQTPDWGSQNVGHSVFDSRQNVLNSRASDDSADLKKKASKTYPIRLSYAVLNVFSQYWWGQNDPLYAVLSRRGNGVDWVTVEASVDELERLRDTAEEIMEDEDSSDEEKKTAEKLLEEFVHLNFEEEQELTDPVTTPYGTEGPPLVDLP